MNNDVVNRSFFYSRNENRINNTLKVSACTCHKILQRWVYAAGWASNTVTQGFNVIFSTEGAIKSLSHKRGDFKNGIKPRQNKNKNKKHYLCAFVFLSLSLSCFLFLFYFLSFCVQLYILEIVDKKREIEK